VDWAEFFDNDEFASYRKLQVEAVAKHVYGLVNHISHKPEDARELKGAMDMAHKILNLPQTTTKDTAQLTKYALDLQQDMAGIAAGLVIKRFEG
jgi:hypothetical protein